MAKKVEPESHDIRSAPLPGQKRDLKNAIRTQSEQLLILKKVRYLDGGDDNLSIPTECSDLPDPEGSTSPDPIAAEGGVSGYFDAEVDDATSERTDGLDPSDLMLMEEVAISKNEGPTWALIHCKEDGFLAMANAGRIFPDLRSNKGYIPVSFHEFKQHMKCYVYTLLQNGFVIDFALESFDLIDPATDMDLIPPMVFGSKFSAEWDCRGMYCAILTEGSCVIMVVLLIVLGIEVEEVPLVATRTKDKGLGYFQALFSCIERLLMLLKVKHLLLHAAEEAESIWKIKFGFTNITSSQLQDYAKGVKLQPVWAKTYQN